MPTVSTCSIALQSAIPPGLAENLRVPIGQGITGTAAATGHSVRVSDVSVDPRYINAIESVRSEMAVPLMLRGKCIGVLDIQSQQPDYFTKDQQRILTILASRLAVAIENARLFQQVSNQAETLLVLNEVSREMSSILDVEELLRRAAEPVKRVIDYQILSLMLYDEDQKIFRHRIDVKHGQRVQGKLRVAATEGIVGAAATLREPVIVPDVTADPRYLMVNPETRSELAIPMMHKGKVIGVLDLESPQINYFTLTTCRRFPSWQRIWPFLWKMRGFTNKSLKMRRVSIVICKPPRAFRARC